MSDLLFAAGPLSLCYVIGSLIATLPNFICLSGVLPLHWVMKCLAGTCICSVEPGLHRPTLSYTVVCVHLLLPSVVVTVLLDFV